MLAVLAVRTQRVVKRFGSTTALDGIDLQVAPGEVRGLLGPNGAGKTTMLRILFGLIRADEGRVELLDRELAEVGTMALHGVGGFVEDPCFYPYLSARANLALLARLDGSAADPGRVDEALHRVDLFERAGDRVGGYSTGMRQRLGIAAALLRRPRLMLLDEPTSGLDPAGARAVAGLVQELSAEGVAVLLSSHQIGELERVCTTYTFLRAGRVVWDGTADQMEARAPVSAYGLMTSDDAQAAAIAGAVRGVVVRPARRSGLAVAVPPEALDELVLALGDARIAVRRLELLVSPLESMFFWLTGEDHTEAGSADFAEKVLSGIS